MKFNNIELLAAKVYGPTGVITTTIFFGNTFYVVLSDGTGEQPLLDSNFPDVSSKGRDHQINAYPGGSPTWKELRKVSIWQTASAMKKADDKGVTAAKGAAGDSAGATGGAAGGDGAAKAANHADDATGKTPAADGEGADYPPFQVTKEQDPNAALGKHMELNYFSITSMPSYQDKSFEELRFEDYGKGNKGSAPVARPVAAAAGVAAAKQWKAARDPHTGRVYYYDVATLESQWTKPPELSTEEEMADYFHSDLGVRLFPSTTEGAPAPAASSGPSVA